MRNQNLGALAAFQWNGAVKPVFTLRTQELEEIEPSKEAVLLSTISKFL
jgi:hypothetical protein